MPRNLQTLRVFARRAAIDLTTRPMPTIGRPGGPTGQGPGPGRPVRSSTEAGDAVDAYPQSGLRHILHRLRLDSARLTPGSIWVIEVDRGWCLSAPRVR